MLPCSESYLIKKHFLQRRLFDFDLLVCLSKVEDEVEVILTIKDVNDNHPEFLTFENPVQVSVSSQLQAGDIIAKMEVRIISAFS